MKFIGLIIFGIGAVSLVGFGLYQVFTEFFTSPEIPLVIKIGITALVSGIIIILISLIRERLKDKKQEKL